MPDEKDLGEDEQKKGGGRSNLCRIPEDVAHRFKISEYDGSLEEFCSQEYDPGIYANELSGIGPQEWVKNDGPGWSQVNPSQPDMVLR